MKYVIMRRGLNGVDVPVDVRDDSYSAFERMKDLTESDTYCHMSDGDSRRYYTYFVVEVGDR